MRLYVNTKEVPLLKDALQGAMDRCESVKTYKSLVALFERVELCEELQKSERRAKEKEKEKEKTNND